MTTVVLPTASHLYLLTKEHRINIYFRTTNALKEQCIFALGKVLLI